MCDNAKALKTLLSTLCFFTFSLTAISDHHRASRSVARHFPDAIGARIIHGAQPMTPYQAVTPGAEVAPDVNFKQ